MSGKIPMPKDGKGPMMKTGGNPTKPEAKVKQVARGAPTKGSGSDTSPYSSARGRRS
jgi:hypothetical protein